MAAISELHRSLNAVDSATSIRSVMVGRWLAWPILKIALAGQAIASSEHQENVAAGWSGIAGYVQRLMASGRALIRDGRLAAQPGLSPSGSELLLIGVRKPIATEDGLRDFFFGDLETSEWAGSALFLAFPRIDEPILPHRNLIVHLARARLLAKLLMLPMLVPAVRLSRGLYRAGNRCKPRIIRTALVLANFEARRLMFRRFLRRSRVRTVVMTYAPGRMPEVAAAREMGLPVIELQHGVFGSHDPDYGWSAALRPLKANMPLPDRVAVFGPRFRELLLDKGFWDEQDIAVVGCAAIDMLKPTPRTPASRFRVCFFSQPLFHGIMRDILLDYARDPRRLQTGVFELILHPEETDGEQFYQPLQKLWPDLRITKSSGNPLSAIAAADVLVACNSLALLEACGLGRAAISLSLPDGSGGLSDVMSDRSLESAIPHVATGSELAERLHQAHSGSTAANRADAAKLGQQLYATGWKPRLAALIRQFSP